MTTTVKVTACCSAEKEVLITTTGKPDKVIQDREEYSDVVYDGIVITVQERIK